MKMTGRSFLLAVSVMLFGLSATAEAQRPKEMQRIVFLSVQRPSFVKPRLDAFRQGLRELGYIEGKNIIVQLVHSDGSQDGLAALLGEAMRPHPPALIVTGGSQATRVAKQVTATTPIVMAQDNDPLGAGFVASLARPGGNITGLANLSADLGGKQLELLREILPKFSRLAVLSDSTEPGTPTSLKHTETAAKAYGVQVFYLDVTAESDIELAFLAATNKRAEAGLVMPSPVFNQRRTGLAQRATKSRLPVMYPRVEYVDDGGLITYGVNTSDLFRRAAIFVDKILKGAKPGDLPAEQPTNFDLVINLKAAKQIGLTIPPNVLARADRVIR
jgi:putative tryptophan/tyrosine transport system substrate-binding protein